MNKLKTLALAVRDTPWQPMAGMPTNILNAGGLRIARCDFDGDFDHRDARANAAYITAASPDVILRLLAERDAAMVDAKRYQWLKANITFVGLGTYRAPGSDLVSPMSRRWYHQTTDMKSNTLDELADAAMKGETP